MKTKRTNAPNIVVVLIIIYSAFSYFDFFFIGAVGSLSKYFAILIIGAFLLTNKKILVQSDIKFHAGWIAIASISLLLVSDYSRGLSFIFGYTMNVLLALVSYNSKWDELSIKTYRRLFFFAGTVLLGMALISKNTFSLYSTRSTVVLFGHTMDPNKLSYFLIPLFAMSLNCATDSKRKALFRLLFVAICLLCVVETMRTGSRSGIIALIVTLIVYFAKKIDTKNSLKVIIPSIIVLLLLYRYYGVILSHFSTEVATRMSISTFSEGDTRINLWTSALKYFWGNGSILLGIGIGEYGSVFGMELHNLHLETLVETGIIGYSFFIISFAVLIKRANKRHDITSVSMIYGILIAIFFLNGYSEKFLWNVVLYSTIHERFFWFDSNEKNSSIDCVQTL